MAVNKVFQANVLVNGTSLLGFVSEADIPGPTATTAVHNSLASLGDINLPTGFDAMEGRFKWQGMDEIIDRTVSNPYDIFSVQVRSNIEKYGNGPTKQNVGAVYFMEVRWRNAPNSNFAAKTDIDSETMFDVLSIRKEIGGREMYAFDPVNRIHRVNGVNLLIEVNANLGVL